MPKLKKASVSKSVREGMSSIVRFLPFPVYWVTTSFVLARHQRIHYSAILYFSSHIWYPDGRKRQKENKKKKTITWSRRKSANCLSSSLMDKAFFCKIILTYCEHCHRHLWLVILNILPYWKLMLFGNIININRLLM